MNQKWREGNKNPPQRLRGQGVFEDARCTNGHFLGSDTEVRALEVALEFALLLLLREVRALVVELLASAEADLNLHEGAAEVDAERDESVAVFLQLAEDLIDLGLMEEELAVAQRVLVKDVALLVRIHMHAVDEDLSVFYVAEGFLYGALAEAE